MICIGKGRHGKFAFGRGKRGELADFSQLFIDGSYQGRGYEEEADLYEKLGFRETGEVDEDEIVMVKEL